MSSLETKFRTFFPFIKFCITARVIAPIGGNWKISIFFAFITIQSVIFTIFAILNFTEKMSDENVTIMEKALDVLIIQGFFQTLLKNFGGTPFRKNFEALVDWLEELHVGKDENRSVQEIFDDELTKALKYCKIFTWACLALCSLSTITFLIKFVLNDTIVILIPYLEPSINMIFYQILQFICFLILTGWIITSDLSIVFIEFYVISFMKSINRMITSLSDLSQDKKKYSHNLLQILEKHVVMLRILRTFNEAVKLISLVQLFMSILLLLSIFLSIQANNEEIGMYITFASITLTLAMLCVFGQMIQTQTMDIFDNLYQTNWYDFTLYDQTILLLMMTNSCKAIGLKAAGMYDVNLTSFVEILKISFSYSVIVLTFAGK
uniref:Odorant receptor n=1 Tax=Lutzomyia longipalpis TaxID=7200 RepID=A0A240SXZ7_LUTLO